MGYLAIVFFLLGFRTDRMELEATFDNINFKDLDSLVNFSAEQSLKTIFLSSNGVFRYIAVRTEFLSKACLVSFAINRRYDTGRYSLPLSWMFLYYK